MSKTNCWIHHDWGKWEPVKGPNNEVWQQRICHRCGYRVAKTVSQC